MKILLLTQYFPPETGAPQNRLHSLVNYLSEFGAEISVLTAMPNYPKTEIYEGYKRKWYIKESDDRLIIHRTWIYVNKSKGIIPRLINYFSFVFTSLIIGVFRIKRHDIIICESPPIFLAITALLLKWTKGSKLVFNVSDLWPESAEKLKIVTNKTLLNLVYKLEAYVYKKSDMVCGQTQGIIDSIKNRFPKVNTHLLRNGIDVKQFSKIGNRDAFRNRNKISCDAFVIAYAGIIGHAQGLEIILKAAKILEQHIQILFMLVGDGPVKQELVDKAETINCKNVVFMPSVPRNEMPDVIAACDCYVTPLRKIDLFLGAIPSKIFEPLYYGKPVIMGVDGEAKHLFVDIGKCALHFEPENEHQLAEQVIRLYMDRALYDTLGRNGHQYVANYFDRKNLAKVFWDKLNIL